MLVDCQSHLFPPFYPDLIENAGGSVAIEKSDEELTIVFRDLLRLRVRLDIYDPKSVVRRMDESGVDVSIMSVNMPGPELLPPEFACEASRSCNDYVADVCSVSGGRLFGLGTIPFDNVEFSVDEISRVSRNLGLRGIVLYSNIAGKPVDSPKYEPIYRALESAGIPLVLHPAMPAWAEVIGDYSMIPMLGFMVDTSIAMLRLILSGILERFPDLKIVHPHCGGVLPYLIPRVVEQTEKKGRGRENITTPPDRQYKNIYMDLVTPSSEHMSFTASQARPDRLLFGTDAPWVNMKEMVGYFKDAKMSRRTRRLASGENAAALFRI